MAEIIWTRAGRPPRGPQPSLSREKIAAAAVCIADRHGLDAVSMRRVAAVLDCGTMSLYRYVRTKDELHTLMRDWVAGEDDLAQATPSGDWRADLGMMAHRLRAGALHHPWLPALTLGPPCFGPNEMRGIELILSALDGLGLSADEMLNVIGVVSGFVQGFVQRELAEREWRRPDGARVDKEWQHGMARYLSELAESGQYPHFTRVRAEVDKSPDPDAVFQWQLDRVLDGLAAVLPAPDRPRRQRQRGASAHGGDGQLR
jgi:AcrR family transcriptional regulator